MISFTLPRFCDQSLDRSRKERFYPGAEPWIAKLDTVVHELYHIDPELAGIRRIEREDGTYSANCHGHQFFEQVAEMVHAYLEHQSDRRRSTISSATISPRSTARHGGVVGTSFRTSRRSRSATSSGSPSSCRARRTPRASRSSRCACRSSRRATREDDLHVRQFMRETSRRLLAKARSAPRRSRFRIKNSEFVVRILNSKFRILNSRGAGAEEARRPVARADALDAHHARRARRVDELVAADRDRDVRWRPGAVVVKKIRSPGASSSGFTDLPDSKLIAHLARQRHAVLREDVLREAAAVEPGRVGAAVAIGRAAQRERGADQRVAVDRGARPSRWRGRRRGGVLAGALRRLALPAPERSRQAWGTVAEPRRSTRRQPSRRQGRAPKSRATGSDDRVASQAFVSAAAATVPHTALTARVTSEFTAADGLTPRQRSGKIQTTLPGSPG